MKKDLNQLVDEASLIVDQLNNLDYRSSVEDAEFMNLLSQLDSIHNQLSGIPEMVAPKTSVYLQ